MTFVVDASVVVAFLTGDASVDEQAALRSSTDAPALLDVEVTQTLRRLLRRSELDVPKAETARAELLQLSTMRHLDAGLLPRAWELRDRCTTYDALYVALAERLDATLVTRDEHLARGVADLVSVATT